MNSHEGGRAPQEPASSMELQLLLRVAERDEAAFSLLYERVRKPIFSFIYRMVGNQALAEDLLADVLFQVWENASQFRGESKAMTWLFTIARNRVISHLRKRSHDQLDENRMDEMVDPAPSPSTILGDLERQKIMLGLLDRLNVEHREVLLLAYYQGMSLNEMSEVLDCSETTIKSRMFHARTKLRWHMERLGLAKDSLL
jgi:RNA polymerase sigma-70 factor, ECF subfamily